MGIEYAEKEMQSRTMSDNAFNIKVWRKTKEVLLFTADAHKKRAEKLRKNNPALAAELMKRAKKLVDEAAAMSRTGKGKNGISMLDIRRANVLGWFALYKDRG